MTSNPGGLFAVSGNTLRVAGALDFESATIHQITAEVSDGQGGTATQVFNITVTDVNEGGGSVGQVVNGGPGNDTLDSTAGNDTINGFGGIDTVIYDFNKDQVNFTWQLGDGIGISVDLPGGVNKPAGMLSGGRDDQRVTSPGDQGFRVERGATINQTGEPRAAIDWPAADGSPVPDSRVQPTAALAPSN